MKPLVFCCLIILIGLPLSALHQKQPSNNYPDDIVLVDNRVSFGVCSVATVVSNNLQSVTIPIKRAGNLIVMDALIDSIYGNLILDTGAEGMVLNSIYFRQNRKSSGLVAGGITGTTGTVAQSKISRLQIAELRLSDINVNVTDLGHIENARNVKVLGFFGLNLLSGFEVILDLRNNFLQLNRLDDKGNRINEDSDIPDFDVIVPAMVSSDVLFIKASVNQRTLIFCLDTGAETNVLSSALSNKVLNSVSIFRRATLRGVGAQNVEVVYGVMNDFSIENRPVTGMTSIITNLSVMGGFYKMGIDGMLGCDFFEKGVFHINIRKKNIGIKFNREDNK